MEEIIIRETNTILQFCLIPPSEALSLGGIQKLARRSVRLRGVPPDLSLKPDDPRHRLRELPDGDLLARSGIHCLFPGIMIHQIHTEIGQIIHIQKFTQRRSVTPACYLRKTRLLRLMETPDQSRQNMRMCRVIIVIRTI